MKKRGMRLVIWVNIFLVFPVFVFAYSDTTTHPALTDEIVDLFNLYYPGLQISDAEKEFIKQGSIDEDNDPRYLNHFYDPVYHRGLWGNSTAKNWAVDTFSQAIVDPGYTSGSALDSLYMHYFDSRTDFTWDRAVYDYVWKDKARGLKSLGHILHLLEDMSVPDHTRNDPHPPVGDMGSPYEAWTSKFTPSNIDGLALGLYRNSNIPIAAPGLQNYFDSLANYSNNNFFSKDTILFKDYFLPKIGYESKENLKNGKSIIFAYHQNNHSKLAARLAKFSWQETLQDDYFLDDPDDQVLTDYWSRLSKQSVLRGAGVVKLFFETVKKERANKALLARNKNTYDNIAGALGFGSADPEPIAADIPESAFKIAMPPIVSESLPETAANSAPAGENEGGVLSFGEPELINAVPTEMIALDLQSVSQPQISLPNAGFGGGMPSAGPVNEISLPSESVAETQISNSSANSDEPDAADTDQEPLLPILPADAEPPDLSFKIAECAKSISKDKCLLLDAKSVTLLWDSAAEDLDYYESNSATTTATSTVYILPGNGAFAFAVSASDKAGNKSEAKTISLESKAAAGVIIINEVAWRGTAADSADEWIELYNPTDDTILLDGWVLYAEDGKPYIPLEGEIKPHDYFLLERKDDNAVSDAPANLIYGNDGPSWALNNSGEILILSFASTTIDKTAKCGQGTTFWCSSASITDNPSMERIDFEILGEDAANWGTADNAHANGTDSAGNKILGTPKVRNSLHYFVSVSNILARDKTLKSFFKEYIVKGGQKLTVPAGFTLTIEPGVTINMGNQAEIEISGNLRAEGSEEGKILFTAVDPKNFWENIRIMPESANSKISNVIFEYGGRYFDNTQHEKRAMLSILGNQTPVLNSRFEYAYGSGLYAADSEAEIGGNKFSTGTSTRNYGMIVDGGAPKILDNVFSGNYQALQIKNESRAKVSGNEFKDSENLAVSSADSGAEFRDNFGAHNGKNAIYLSDGVALSGATTTLYQNNLPYWIGEHPYSQIKIPQGSGVSVEKGARFEGAGSNSLIEVAGTLELGGEARGDIIFTSAGDSEPGEWRGILVENTGLIYGGGFTLRYAGKQGCPSCVGFGVNGGKLNLSNGLIQNNFKIGMRLTNSSSTLRNFEFRDHQTPKNGATALASENSDLILENLIFDNNFINTSPEGLY